MTTPIHTKATLRDQFAMQAFGTIAIKEVSIDLTETYKVVARAAYGIADAMLEERK